MGWKNKVTFDIAEALVENDTIGSYVLDPAGVLIDPRDIRALTNADVVTVEQGSSPWVVSATDLDIRDLVFATDKVDVSGSVVALDAATLAALESITVQNPAGAGAVNIQDGGNSITVDAVDLDIRDLVAATDSVSSWTKDGAGTSITSTLVSGKQGLDVNLVNEIAVAIRGVYDVSTNPNPDNVGIVASTRTASPADAQQTFRPSGGAASSDDVTAANVQGLDTNAFNMVFDGTNWDRMRSRNNELLVNDTANTAILQTQKDVTTSTGALLAGQLANRKYLLIQNAGSGTVYIGAAGVTAANGFPLSGGSVAELRCGPAVSVHAVTNTGTRDARLLELS